MFSAVERTGHAGSEANIPLRMSLLLRNESELYQKIRKGISKRNMRHKIRLQYD